MLPQEGGRVGGLAFLLAADVATEVLGRLDHRERGGYGRATVDLHPAAGGAPFATGLVYHATPDNPNYLGPADPEAIVAQILASAGPSGPNPEYLLRLDEALIELGLHDEHVHDLARRARRRLGAQDTAGTSSIHRDR